MEKAKSCILNSAFALNCKDCRPTLCSFFVLLESRASSAAEKPLNVSTSKGRKNNNLWRIADAYDVSQRCTEAMSRMSRVQQALQCIFAGDAFDSI